MQLSEIKNDLATINYSPEINRLMLGDFILVEDTNQSILAQIISIEATLEEDVNSAMLKFLLSIDKEANLTQYSGYVPAKNASLILINPEEVVQLIKGTDKNINLGSLAAYPDVPVELSMDFLRKKTYIQVDYVENKFQIVKSIIKGLEKHNRKTLLFDFQGLYEGLSLPTVTIGYNFKLPLNYDALCYIAEEELNEFGNENKAILQGILIEVQNYVKTTKDEFIPFDTLISVLDAQYDESPLSELLLLKNKLLKYQQQGLFAQEKSEFDFLDSFLKDAKNFKFDLSEVPSQWHKIAIVSILNIIKAKCYLIADFTDDNSNKTIIKKLYEKTEIKPIVISSYSYKYQLQLKAMSKNLILFKPIQKVNDFAGYTSFLNILSQDTFIVWGEQTLYIPLILKINNDNNQKIDKISYQKIQNSETDIKPELEQENITDTAENTQISETAVIDEPIEVSDYLQTNEIENSESEDILDTVEIDEATEDTADNQNVEDNSLKEQPEIEISSSEFYDDIPTSNDMDFFFDEKEDAINEVENNIDNLIEEEQNASLNEPDVEPDLSPDNAVSEDLPDIDADIIQESEDEITDDFNDTQIDDNLTDIENNIPDHESEYTEEIAETEVNQDDFKDNIENETDIVDDFQDNLDEETEIIDDFQDISDENNDNISANKTDPLVTESIVESDKIADDIPGNDDDNITEESEVDLQNKKEDEEEILKSPSTATVKKEEIPVYTSNVAPQFDIKFAQGTYVHHPKYGRGVVEKVINYGSKELCLIIFDNDGRKLLDPNIADLKQI